MRDSPSETGRLDALLVLDRQARVVSSALLAQYVEGAGQLRSFDWRCWLSATQLCQSFFRAYESFLPHVLSAAGEDWTKRGPRVLAQLFHHRKTEFLLRFLRYKKRKSEHWQQLNEMYRLALERGMLNCAQAACEPDGGRGATGNAEQEYLQILLLEAMNSGHFSPHEALWAHRWFGRWCNGPTLRLTEVAGSVQGGAVGFVVDLGGSDGLKRAPATGGKLLHFDSSPLSVMIDQETASLRAGAAPAQPAAPAERAGQLALLNKLAVVFAPHPAVNQRRAERKPVAVTVQAIAGLSCIIAELWHSGQKPSGAAPFAAAPGTEVTIAQFGRSARSPLFAAAIAGQEALSSANRQEAKPLTWQVKDRSDWGCRMRGQIDDLNRVIPGSLMALRDRESAPWTVAVVRWFRRLMVDHVEIGVEYLGRRPRFIKMVADDQRQEADNKTPDGTAKCFAALYLPPSEESPTMPIKTLLLPASEFRAGCEVTLLSSSATFRARLCEPIQQQAEFVLTPFAVISQVAPAHARSQTRDTATRETA